MKIKFVNNQRHMKTFKSIKSTKCVSFEIVSVPIVYMANRPMSTRSFMGFMAFI